MIILSFNLHGFGGPTKIASLKLLLKQVNPDIVFLQETLVDGEKAKRLFLQCLPMWNVVALDPSGRSGGLLSGWNPTYAELCAFGTSAGIYLEGRFKQSAEKIKLLNCYAPYKDREFFGNPLLILVY
jgi:exonuclease III